MPTAYLGKDAKAYYGTAGVSATTELTNVRNVTLNLDKAEADVTIRGGDGWRQMVGTLKEGSAEFEMLFDPADAGFVAIQAAWENDTAIALKFLHAASGSGLDGDFAIINFNRPEPLEEAITVNVTAKLTTSSRAPQWV